MCLHTRRRRTAIAHTYLCRYFLTYRSHPDRKPVVSRFAHNKNQPLELMALAARFVRRPAQLPADAFKTVETVAARGLKHSLCVHARGDAAFLERAGGKKLSHSHTAHVAGHDPRGHRLQDLPRRRRLAGRSRAAPPGSTRPRARSPSRRRSRRTRRRPSRENHTPGILW